jgi:hypothetical protein
MAKIMNEINNLDLSPENAKKANLLLEMGFFYNGLVDDELIADSIPQEIESDWKLYSHHSDKCVHAVINDHQFTYSFLDDVIDETNVNLDDLYRLMDAVENTVK